MYVKGCYTGPKPTWITLGIPGVDRGGQPLHMYVHTKVLHGPSTHLDHLQSLLFGAGHHWLLPVKHRQAGGRQVNG
jgi:hypothetical protein